MKFNNTWPPPEPPGGWALPKGATFICPAGIVEDEIRRNTKPTAHEQFKHDLGLDKNDPLPNTPKP